MDRLKYITLFAGLSLMGACTSEEAVPGEGESENVEFRLFASRPGIGVEIDTRADDPKNTTFKEGDKIRFANTRYFNEPDFKDEKAIFTYAQETCDKNGNTYYKFTQTNAEEGETLNWNNFSPTTYVYTFEASYTPDGEYLEEVAADQDANNGAGFWSSDLMLAHHRMLLEERYKAIYLNFRHVFVKVKVIFETPIGVLSLPENAVQSATLQNVQRGFIVDYTTTIENDGLRTVRGDGEPETVKMWKSASSTRDTEHGKVQTYTFLGIIPFPSINPENTDFVRFEVKYDENTTKTYRFVPTKGNLVLEPEHIVTLKIILDEEGLKMPINAVIEPWEDATSEMPLFPEKDESSQTPKEGENGEEKETEQKGGDEQ